METVRSDDGTTIAFERSGTGPALVMALGAFNDRHTKAALRALLVPRFTVFAYDRRGRGDSGDTPPYAVEREIEDLAAVIEATGAGGSARVFGHSSGAVLALRAAAAGVPIAKVAAFEPPVAVIDGNPAVGGGDANARLSSPAKPANGSSDAVSPGLPLRVQPFGDLAARVAAEVAAGRRGEAAKLFMLEGVGIPAEVVAMIEASPGWPSMEAIAHTLPYDLTITGAALAPTLLATIGVPTLVIDGSASPPFMHETASAIATAVPDAKHVTLPDQTHDEDPHVLSPVLIEFLA